MAKRNSSKPQRSNRSAHEMRRRKAIEDTYELMHLAAERRISEFGPFRGELWVESDYARVTLKPA